MQNYKWTCSLAVQFRHTQSMDTRGRWTPRSTNIAALDVQLIMRDRRPRSVWSEEHDPSLGFLSMVDPSKESCRLA